MLDLSEKELTYLRNFNLKLSELEHMIFKEVKAIEPGLKERLSQNDPFLSDYEIEVVLDYRLREDDPAYRDDSDNILAERHDCFRNVSYRHFGLGDGKNHNEFRRDGHPMKGEHHCWLFHELYDHDYLDSPCLSWKDIMRIGMVWVDIQVRYQHFLELSNLRMIEG